MASVNISIVRDNGTSINLNGPVDDVLFSGIGQTLSDQLGAAVTAITSPVDAPAPAPVAAPAPPAA